MRIFGQNNNRSLLSLLNWSSGEARSGAVEPFEQVIVETVCGYNLSSMAGVWSAPSRLLRINRNWQKDADPLGDEPHKQGKNQEIRGEI